MADSLRDGAPVPMLETQMMFLARGFDMAQATVMTIWKVNYQTDSLSLSPFLSSFLPLFHSLFYSLSLKFERSQQPQPISPMSTEVQSLKPFSIAFPGRLAGSCMECGAAGTQTGTRMGWQCYRQCLNPLCHRVSPFIKGHVATIPNS